MPRFTRTTCCTDVLMLGQPEYACDYCKPWLDPLSFTKGRHNKRKCGQPWLEKYKDSHYIGARLKYEEIHKMLGTSNSSIEEEIIYPSKRAKIVKEKRLFLFDTDEDASTNKKNNRKSINNYDTCTINSETSKSSALLPLVTNKKNNMNIDPDTEENTKNLKKMNSFFFIITIVIAHHYFKRIFLKAKSHYLKHFPSTKPWKRTTHQSRERFQ